MIPAVSVRFRNPAPWLILAAVVAAPAPAAAKVDKTWALPLMEYSDGMLTLDAVNSAYPLVPDDNRAQFIRKTAKRNKIPADLLLGVYGLCSGNGYFSQDLFGLDLTPGPRRSKSFRNDAKRAAALLGRLYRMLFPSSTYPQQGENR